MDGRKFTQKEIISPDTLVPRLDSSIKCFSHIMMIQALTLANPTNRAVLQPRFFGVFFAIRTCESYSVDRDGRKFNLCKKILFPLIPVCQDRTPISTVSHNNDELKILGTLILPFNCYILRSAIYRPCQRPTQKNNAGLQRGLLVPFFAIGTRETYNVLSFAREKRTID